MTIAFAVAPERQWGAGLRQTSQTQRRGRWSVQVMSYLRVTPVFHLSEPVARGQQAQLSDLGQRTVPSGFWLRVASPGRGKSNYCSGQELAGMMGLQLPGSLHPPPSRFNPTERLGLGEGQGHLHCVGAGLVMWFRGTVVESQSGAGGCWVCEP